MSFNFKWPNFSENFYNHAKQTLYSGLNKGSKPPIIADDIHVEELNMGTIPPELRILSIGDIASDRFRGIFQLTYSGDAYIVLRTLVQANPLTHLRSPPLPTDLPSSVVPRMLFASSPLLVPMHLRLSDLKLSATVVLVVSLQKGVTLVFKNDPLQGVNVSSTFDKVGVIQGFIQREIEGQLRELFRSDLPELIHGISRKWFEDYRNSKLSSQTSVSTSTPTPSPAPVPLPVTSTTPVSASFPLTSPLHPPSPTPSPRTTPPLICISSVPDSIENYDPTYGLRPEGLPVKSKFGTYRRLLSREKKRGLGSVLESDGEREADEQSEEEQEREREEMVRGLGVGSEDLVRPGDDYFNHHLLSRPLLRSSASSSITTASSLLPKDPSFWPSFSNWSSDSLSMISGNTGISGSKKDKVKQYIRIETLPAVGGGTISRPRVLHSMSYGNDRDIGGGSLMTSGSDRGGKGKKEGRGQRWMKEDEDDDWRSTISGQTISDNRQTSSTTALTDSNSSNSLFTTLPPSSTSISTAPPSPLTSSFPSDPQSLLSIDPSDFNRRKAVEEVILDPRENGSCGMMGILSRSNLTMSVYTRGWEGSEGLFSASENGLAGGGGKVGEKAINPSPSRKVSSTFSAPTSTNFSSISTTSKPPLVAKIISKPQTPLLLLERKKNLEIKQFEQFGRISNAIRGRGGGGGRAKRKRVWRIGEAKRNWELKHHEESKGSGVGSGQGEDEDEEGGREIDEMSEYFPRTECDLSRSE